MSKNKKKKTGLQREVSSIFSGVPIPPKKGYNSPGQPSGESAPENTVENSYKLPLYTPEKQQNFPVQKPRQAIPQDDNNLTIRPTEPPVVESKVNIPSKPVSQEPAKHPGTLFQKLNQSGQNEDNYVQKKPQEEPIPKQAGNIPLKPSQNQTQKPHSSLLQKLSQPPELLRKDTPAKQIVNDEPKETEEPREVISVSQWQQLKDKLLAPKPGVSPTRQKATVVLIPVLAVVLIFVIRQVFWTAPKKTKGADNDAAVAKASGPGNDIEWQIPEPYPSTLRDPMYLVIKNPEKYKPETFTDETEITIAVKGVLYSEDNPAALIGNKIVHIGDIVSGAEIINIGRDSVTFEIDGKRWKENIRP